MKQYVLQYVQYRQRLLSLQRSHLEYQQCDYWATALSCRIALGMRMAKLFFFFGRTKFTHAEYSNIMHVLDLTQQKLNIWIGVTFLLGKAKRSVKQWQPIQNQISI